LTHPTKKEVSRLKASEYLLERLADYDVDHIFGIPGDYIVPFFADAEGSGIHVVTTTHEPSAGYAADAYARMKGLGVAVATWGVGALNMLNAAAQAFAERSPTLFISGAPEIQGRSSDRLLHHEVRDWDTQFRVYREVTCASVNLTDQSQVCEQIDAVLDDVMRLKKPGYIEIPRDVSKSNVEKRSALKRTVKRSSSAGQLSNVTAQVVRLVNESKNPVIYAGVEIERFDLRSELIRFAKKANLPVTTSLLGKSVFPETHPNFAGIYMGAIGSQPARQLVENSDCVLLLGGFLTDIDSGLYTMRIPDANLILADASHVRVHGEVYPDITLTDLIRSLLLSPGFKSRNLSLQKAEVKETTSPQKGLASQTIIEELNNHMSDEMIAVADVGDCLFSCLDLKVNRFIAPAFYASMGFGVPAGIGVALADPTRRPVVLVGDGAFQMTGVELCTARKLEQNPLVIVFNDGYYGTLRAFSPEMKSLELSRWDYANLAKTLGCDGGSASTPEELHGLLNAGLESKLPYVVDARITGPASPLLQRLGELMSKKTKGNAA
jgi:indolepyruvate decarboxylase